MYVLTMYYNHNKLYTPNTLTNIQNMVSISCKKYHVLISYTFFNTYQCM